MVPPGVDICNNLSADLETFLKRGVVMIRTAFNATKSVVTNTGHTC